MTPELKTKFSEILNSKLPFGDLTNLSGQRDAILEAMNAVYEMDRLAKLETEKALRYAKIYIETYGQTPPTDCEKELLGMINKLLS